MTRSDRGLVGLFFFLAHEESTPADHIDFWFTMGSTYPILGDAARRGGASERYPVRLAAVRFAHHLQEMKDVPFAENEEGGNTLARY